MRPIRVLHTTVEKFDAEVPADAALVAAYGWSRQEYRTHDDYQSWMEFRASYAVAGEFLDVRASSYYGYNSESAIPGRLAGSDADVAEYHAVRQAEADAKAAEEARMAAIVAAEQEIRDAVAAKGAAIVYRGKKVPLGFADVCREYNTTYGYCGQLDAMTDLGMRRFDYVSAENYMRLERVLELCPSLNETGLDGDYHALLSGIAADPLDMARWLILTDWIEERPAVWCQREELFRVIRGKPKTARKPRKTKV